MTYEQRLTAALLSLFGGWGSGPDSAKRVILEMGIPQSAKYAFSNRSWLAQRMATL